MLQRLDTGPHSVHMRLLPQEFAMEGLHFHIILLILLYFFVAGVVLVLHGLDAGSHSVHMGLLPQELVLEGWNFHIMLFDCAALFHCWGGAGAPGVGCWITLCAHGALASRINPGRLEFSYNFI